MGRERKREIWGGREKRLGNILRRREREREKKGLFDMFVCVLKEFISLNKLFGNT